jgi:hypothetical protein
MTSHHRLIVFLVRATMSMGHGFNNSTVVRHNQPTRVFGTHGLKRETNFVMAGKYPKVDVLWVLTRGKVD